MVNFMIIECKVTKKIAYAQGLCDFGGCKVQGVECKGRQQIAV